MPEAPFIAADTNVLLDYAKEDETVIGCFDTLRRRLPGSIVLVPPTVLHELADLADEGDVDDIRQASRRALTNIVQPWGFRPVNFLPVGHGIVDQIAQALRGKGLIPEREVNDSYLVAEAGLVGASILLSSDAHVKDIPYAELK